MGVSFARNIGVRKAKGRYICFLDADDIWKDNKLEEQIKFIKENNYERVYSSFAYMNNEGTKISKKINVPYKLDYKKALLNTRIITCTIMIDLEKIPKRYCYMPNIMHEDIATWWKLLKKGYVAYAQNEVLAYCRKAKKSRNSKKIKSAFYRWKLYRQIEELNIFECIYCFIHYVINAIEKRMGIMKSIKKLGNNNLQVLISVQNLRNDADVDKLIKPMNVASDYLIVNQCFDNNIKIENENVITKPEKGLSKSRNLAIKSSKSDIILFADDDVRYNKNYKDIILKSYDKYKDADIICFYIESQNKKRKTKRMHTGKIGYIRAMRVVSTEICCKRESIIKNNLKFNEEFGAGTRFNRGEENIFLYEAIRKGLKVIWVNEKIGEILQEESTWFKEYDEEFFKIQGRVFKELSNKFYMIYILNLAFKQYFKYRKNISFYKAIKLMLDGTKLT